MSIETSERITEGTPMSLTVQNYVARATGKKAQDLLDAAVAVPEDKHS